MSVDRIIIKDAAEHNLKNVDLEIFHNTLTVITGISGSGKSSLAYDIIFNEGQRRYLESISSNVKVYLNRMSRPEVGHISGLKPAVSVHQKTTVRSVRSTVGTLTGIYDILRLLFARRGSSFAPNIDINRNLFSFNTQKGACPACKGLGVVDRIDPDLFVADETKSLREGAFVITAPNGYIIYSQVTMDVLNQVCNAEGFNVDIPWKDLSQKQKNVVLYGSEKIKIPFGKHTLESRMKWSGITAKPRVEGYYKGVIPVMNEILKRDRNKNILRFVRSYKCPDCQGKRLSDEALSVFYQDKNIAEFTDLEIKELHSFFKELKDDNQVVQAIRESVLKRTSILLDLGLGYLTLARESTTLSGGEAQRIRLSNQVVSGLQGILYVLDEPTAGLHACDTERLIRILRKLTNNGNTVIVVEHDPDVICSADRIIDIGPLAGHLGGEILFQGTLVDFLSKKRKDNKTWTAIHEKKTIRKKVISDSVQKISVVNGIKNNLKSVKAFLLLGQFNVVTGISGAGKTSLIEELMETSVKNKTHGAEHIGKVIYVDQSPIGRTPRSNPVTYTSVFDAIRDLFASTQEAKKRKLKKNYFSFNVVGGRCEACHGAGYIQTGMHFIGNVDVLCDSCHGKRFNEEILSVTWKGKNMFDVLEMQIDEAVDFFADKPKIKHTLEVMNEMGLGYITLGQPATTLSGGEAQRIKLASELSKKSQQHILYILDEPTTGLHDYDTRILLKALNRLVEKENTVICITHHHDIILNADHVVDMGPGSGQQGGTIVFQGTVNGLIKNKVSLTGQAIENVLNKDTYALNKRLVSDSTAQENVSFKGIYTNNLKNIDVSIPRNKIIAITGLSGSGKSSFAFDTLFAEGQQRYYENLSAYAREHLSMKKNGEFEECLGITPAIALSQRMMRSNHRSTIGTITEIYDYLRLLYSRANDQRETVYSTLFSFNRNSGACKECKGLGVILSCDPEKLITSPEKPITDGAMNGTKTGKFYGDPYGQYIALLNKVGETMNINFSKPYEQLTGKEKDIVLYGAGDQEFETEWHYKRKNREGVHKFKKAWKGFVQLVNEEYEIRHDNTRGEGIKPVMSEILCPECKGARLSHDVLKFTFSGQNIIELCEKSVSQLILFFNNTEGKISDYQKQISKNILKEINRRLHIMEESGLEYLSLHRRSETLSGGETQRLKLVSLLISELTGVLYVLDEPTLGLHRSEYNKLKININKLIELGNTVVMVEHQPEMIFMADHVIEFGPGSGKHGGEIIYEGTVDGLKKKKDSPTSKFLSYTYNLKKKTGNFESGIQIKGACANNLKNININFPLQALSIVTGVSGAGKTSLLYEVLYKTAQAGKPVNCNLTKGIENFSSVIYASGLISSGSINSNILTYTGLFDTIRDMFAATEHAKKQKLKKSDFSFNQKGGRCEHCKGIGELTVSMDFLPDVVQTCEMCHGKRFQETVLSCTISGKSIFDILSMTVDDLNVFAGSLGSVKKQDDMLRKLQLIHDSGLGYIVCGQPTSTLSGGEMQRLNLISELIKSKKEKQLFLLDEPSSGLHYEDIEKLMKIFRSLVNAGHTVILADNKEIILQKADYFIELGPGGGEFGGEVL